MTNDITWRLEHDKIGPLLMHYALPAVIGTMVNALYNIVDRIYIGQGVGALAISGLTLTFPIMLLLQAFGVLVGAGASTRISIFLGRKENNRAEQILGTSLLLSLLLSLLTVVPTLLFMKELLREFGGSDLTIPFAEEYLYIAIPGNALATLSFSFNSAMRASGYPKKAMTLMLLGAILNVILDPIFIFWFDMGIQGAAIATVISMTVSAALVLSHFIRKDSLIRFRRKYLRLEWPYVLSIITIGISPFMMQLAASLVNVVMNNSLYKYGGDLAVGANGIISSVGMLILMLNLGIAMGMQPIVGFNYGAGHQKRVLETLKWVIIVNSIITGLGFVCCALFPGLIVRGFTNDPALIAIAANGLRITICFFFVVGSQVSITQFFQSIGMAGKSIFMSLSRQILFLIPAIITFPLWFGLDGVWMAYPFSDIIAAITGWIMLAQYVKKSKRANVK